MENKIKSENATPKPKTFDLLLQKKTKKKKNNKNKPKCNNRTKNIQ